MSVMMLYILAYSMQNKSTYWKSPRCWKIEAEREEAIENEDGMDDH